MLKNPILNAAFAALYIIGIVFVLHSFIALGPAGDTILIPMAMLSLFVLSAAVMAFLFGYQPLQLYFSGEKEHAIRFFLTQLATFAVFTVCIVVAMTLTLLAR